MKSRKSATRQSAGNVVQPQRVNRALHSLMTLLGIQSPRSRTLSPFSQGLPVPSGDREAFAIGYLAAEYLSKLDDGKSSDQKESAAWDRFRQAEAACKETNERLLRTSRNKHLGAYGDVGSVLYTASRKIQGVLGPFCWNQASRHFGFGPGGTTRLPRSKGHGVHKYSGRPETTIGNACLAHAAIMQKDPLWTEGLEFRVDIGYCDIVPGNRVITVPKNYKTDRVIAAEPCMNIYIQKGIGGLIRDRLRRVGVNLNDQRHNQRLALAGSLDGSLATIDLSMASDTVSSVLVRHLLPPDWLVALEQCRSPVGTLPTGERIVYQKFSSMGNGYTFELESLIFWALCQACYDYLELEDRRIAVYGDDIIVPTAAVQKVVDTLAFCGFTCNTKKTHVSGGFRESCGKHFLSGYDVTPFYVKREVKSLRDLFLLHNNVYRWSARAPLAADTLEGVERWLEEVREIAPRKWRRPRIPDGFGDGAFVGSFEQCAPHLHFEQVHKGLGMEGWTVEILADVSQLVEVDTVGRLTWSLSEVGRVLMYPYDGLRCEAGGATKPPRMREVMTLVPLFPRQDHFCRVT